MLTKMIRRERRVVQFYTLALFLAISAVFLMITYYIQSNTDTILKNEIEIGEQSLVEVEKAYMVSKISGRVSDVLYIGDSLMLGELSKDDYAEAKEEWMAFANRKAFYDQIRYIGADGNEVIRINDAADGAIVVPKEKLQNKKDRDYFIQTVGLEANQVYISPLDLNIENGVVETPIRPMLRFSTPFIQNGSREGIVILNYNAMDILEQVALIASSSAGSIFLLNGDGYWLYNAENPDTEWAFMYEDRQDISFANEFPQEWGEIANTGNGVLVSERGVFHYTSLDLRTDIAPAGSDSQVVSNSFMLYLVSYIDTATDTGALFMGGALRLLGKVLMKYLSIYFLISGIAFALAVLVAVGKAQRKEIRYFSEHDVLTGVYNRRSAYQKLNDIRKSTDRKNCMVSICFLDINGLKEINDLLGHDAGDELIKTVTDIIQKNIRTDDFVARLGGDEFLIIFEGIGAETAEKSWERIVRVFGQINDAENRRYVISVSHGIKQFTCDMDTTVDDAIQQADMLMYQEKSLLKRDLRAVRRREESSVSIGGADA